jgi:hypothetical protein
MTTRSKKRKLSLKSCPKEESIDNCAICCDSLTNGKETITTNPCEHTFHHDCLAPWCIEKEECPTCRTEIPITCSILNPPVPPVPVVHASDDVVARVARIRAMDDHELFTTQEFVGADLQGADLRGQYLQNRYRNIPRHLQGANLRGAHFEGANLQNVFITSANLEGAHFEGANLANASFYSSNLEGADFRGAINVFRAGFNNPYRGTPIGEIIPPPMRDDFADYGGKRKTRKNKRKTRKNKTRKRRKSRKVRKHKN